MEHRHIVVIGGGTGLGPVAEGLKRDAYVTAVVPATDRGGSSGVMLRDAVTELPPGDAGKAYIALSDSPETMIRLLRQRIPGSSALGGHSVINVLVAAAQAACDGDFSCGLDLLGEVFSVRGQVLLSTLNRESELCIEREDGTVSVGEDVIDEQRDETLAPVRKVFLDPPAELNPRVARAIHEADAVVLCPGSFYTTLAPNMLVTGMTRALEKSRAKIIAITNLANEKGHTTGWTAHDYAYHIQEMIAPATLHTALINTGRPSQDVVARYRAQNEEIVDVGSRHRAASYEAHEANLLSREVVEAQPGDPVVHRSLLRHDPERLARRILMELED